MHLIESLNSTSTLLNEAAFTKDMVDMDTVMGITQDITDKDPNALSSMDFDNLIKCLIDLGYTPNEVTGAMFVMSSILEEMREVEGGKDFPENESTLESLLLLYAINTHVDSNIDLTKSECVIETIRKIGFTVEDFLAI